jgi:hypothetical protein
MERPENWREPQKPLNIFLFVLPMDRPSFAHAADNVPINEATGSVPSEESEYLTRFHH